MKKYFHQYSTQTNKNIYRHSHNTHPFLNNNTHPFINNNKSLNKQNTTSSFFNTKSTPKSINELNLNNITAKKSTYRQQSQISNKNNKQINSNVNRNDIVGQNQLSQSNKFNIRQSIQSINSQRTIKQRGFSLQYIKMTKRHKIKQLLNFNQSQSSILLMKKKNNNNNNSTKNNNKIIRSKTTFDQPLARLYHDDINDDKTLIYHLRSTQYQSKQQTKLSSLLGNAQSIKQNLLLNKTLNDLKLPKTSSIYSKNILNNTNPLLIRIQFAGNILHKTNQRLDNFKDIQNTPISFVPIDNNKNLSNDKKFFNSNNNKGTNRSTDFDMTKTTLRKSKYSPFKSRNGSAASHNQDIKDIQTKQFQNDNQFQIKPFSTSKDVKTYKLTRHKRIKTQNHNINSNKDLQTRYLSITDNQHTIKIIEQGLYGQIKLLNQLKQCFQIKNQSPSKSDKIPFNKIKQLIKTYVFGQKDSKNYKNQYFSQIDYIFQVEEEKHMIKKVISCERLVIICIVDLLSHQKLLNLVEEVKLTLVTLIVIYLIVWKQVKKLQMYENIDTQIADYYDQLLKISNYKTKSPLEKHLKSSLLPYIENLFRYSKQLFEKECKKLIQESKSRTINRTFYETLKKYAIYLTNNEQRMINKSSGGLISSFATCPAPYILSKPQKRYTLCVDLDETLLYSKFSSAKKFQTSYRPGAKQFIIQLSKYFQIIVFTSSVKQYADQVTKPFVQFIDHTLYRYHVTRGKNLTNTVKDLSRIGRKLQKVIFIDDLQCNIKLQPQNSIKVTPWKGDMNDKEIIQLKSLLLALGKDEMEYDDVRKVVSEIKQKIKALKKKD